MGEHRQTRKLPPPPFESPRWRWLLWLTVKKIGQLILVLLIIFAIQVFILAPLLYFVWQLMLWAAKQ
jgi:uncharacterized integral membrane protein